MLILVWSRQGSFSSVTNPKSTFIDKVSTFLSSIETTSEKFWKNKPIQDLIKSREQYDVIISLNFLNDGLLALNHHLGAPTIIFFPAASSSAINKYVANPNLPYYEDPFMMDVGASNSFLARTLTTSVVCLFSLTERYIMTPRQERPMLSYLPNSPPVLELKKNVSLVMVNAHTSLESASMLSVAKPNSTLFDQAMAFITSTRSNAEKFWKNEAVKNLIESRDRYDLVVSVGFLSIGILALSHHLHAPIVIFYPGGGSSFVNKFVANPNLPYVPNLQIGMRSPQYFLSRLAFVTMVCIYTILEKNFIHPIDKEVTDFYLPNSPTISQLRDNVSLVLVNSHPSIEPSRPYVPNMVQIGGFYAQTTKKLPDNLQKYLDSAKDGAILFSFGTNMKIAEVEKDKLDAIMEGLRKIAPIKVLFKSEIDLKDAPKNVLVSKWLPQNDILAHPNIKAFITHGGLGGNTEAVYHGVPMIGIPLFADQKTNIENAVKSGYAIRIFYEDINQKTVDEALEQILKNPSYTEKAKKRSSLLRKQPMNPMDKAIWWVEHIIEHKGGEHLRNLGMDLEWYQLYMVDIMLFYVFVIVIMLTTSILSMRWIIRKLFFKNKNETKNKKSKKE